MKSNENNRIFRTTSKFSQEDLNEVRNRIINTKGLQTITELENIVNFPDIVRLPRRDAIVWFSMYSVSIANMYKEHDSQGHPTIASFHSLLTYINKNKEIIDETFVFKSDFYYLIRNRFYLYKLNSIFRKIIGNQGLYSNINWTKNIPFTDNEQRILSFLQQPNKIIKEIAYWKYKTNYNVTLKYVYMIDRISRKINQVIKNYQHKSQPFSYFGLRKVTKLEFQFYEEIKPILSDFYDFYNEICPLDDRILPWIDQQTEIIPNYIRIIGANKSKLREYLLEKGNIYDEKGLLESVRILDSPAIFVKDFIKLKKKEIINERYLREKKTYFHNSLLNGFRIRDMVSEIEERYEDYELYLFDGGITVLILIELIEAFIKHFLSSYSKKMQSEYKISFFRRIFEETVSDIVIKNEIRQLIGFSRFNKSVIIKRKFRNFVEDQFREIKFIQEESFFELNKLIKQMTEFSLLELSEKILSDKLFENDEKFLTQSFESIYRV